MNLTNEENSEILLQFAVKMYKRFRRTNTLYDIEVAVQLGRRVLIEECKDRHSETPQTLNNIGIFLKILFECLGRLKDLEEAIRVTRQAVDITPKDSPDIVSWLNNLGSKLES
jgi:hypothetical protein